MPVGPAKTGYPSCPRRYAAGTLRFARPTVRSLRLRTLVALDDHHIACRMRRAQRDGALVFGRVVAGERGRIVRKLEHDIARADLAFGIFELAAAHQEFRAVFA